MRIFCSSHLSSRADSDEDVSSGPAVLSSGSNDTLLASEPPRPLFEAGDASSDTLEGAALPPDKPLPPTPFDQSPVHDQDGTLVAKRKVGSFQHIRGLKYILVLTVRYQLVRSL